MITHGTMDTFNDRLHRIHSGGTTAWTEPGGGLASKRKENRAVRKHKKARSVFSPSFVMSLMLAAMVGALAVILSRYVRYHLVGVTEADNDPNVSFYVDMAMGAAVGFVLTSLFQFEGKKYKLAQLVGVFAMVGLMHNVVWWYPEEVQIAFGPDYVQGIMDSTKPNSFQFRGDSIVW